MWVRASLWGGFVGLLRVLLHGSRIRYGIVWLVYPLEVRHWLVFSLSHASPCIYFILLYLMFFILYGVYFLS